jgi:hypothetical protein
VVLQFDDIGRHGTKVIIFNLWRDDDDDLELDFDTDPHVLFSSLTVFNSSYRASEHSAISVIKSIKYRKWIHVQDAVYFFLLNEKLGGTFLHYTGY